MVEWRPQGGRTVQNSGGIGVGLWDIWRVFKFSVIFIWLVILPLLLQIALGSGECLEIFICVVNPTRDCTVTRFQFDRM